MFRQSPRRYQRNGGMKMKHILQMSLLLGVSIWLFVQVQRSGNRKASSQANLKISEKGRYPGRESSIKLGRKDLKPKAEVYGEDEKPIQVQERNPFDDETKPEDKEPEQDNIESNHHPENFGDSLKEAETEEGGVAKGHVEENENRESDKEGGEDQSREDQVGGKEDKAVEEENGERDDKKHGGDNIENEGANTEVKKKTKKFEDNTGTTFEEANENKESKNDSEIGKLSEDMVQKAKEGVAFIEKKIAKEVSGGENEVKGEVSDDSQQKLPEDGENERKGKVSDDASKKSIVAQEGSDGENAGNEEEREYSEQRLTEDEGSIEKTGSHEKNDAENEGKGNVGNDTVQKSTEDDGVVEKKVSNETSNGENEGESKEKDSTEGYDGEEKGNKASNMTEDSLTENLSFLEGKIGDKQKNNTDGESVTDGTNPKSENGTETEKGNKKTAAKKTKKSSKVNPNELLSGGEYDSTNGSNEQLNETNSGLSVNLNASRAMVDGNSSDNETNLSDETQKSGNNTKPEDKTASYDDSNGNDDGQSNMDNFSNLSSSSSVNETVDKSTDNEGDSSSASLLPQEEKEARTDLDTLPESGNEGNNRIDAMLSDI